MNPSTHLSLTTRLLHWSVALLMIGLTLVGYLMVKFEIWDLYALHKSLGVIALILILPAPFSALLKGGLSLCVNILFTRHWQPGRSTGVC